MNLFALEKEELDEKLMKRFQDSQKLTVKFFHILDNLSLKCDKIFQLLHSDCNEGIFFSICFQNYIFDFVKHSLDLKLKPFKRSLFSHSVVTYTFLTVYIQGVPSLNVGILPSRRGS